MTVHSYLHWPLAQVPMWSARWIAPEGIGEKTNVYFRARRKWLLTKVPTQCILHITAESSYRLYINGEWIGLGPIRGTRSRNYLDSYEISSLLRSGENWIAVAVHSPNVPTFKAAPSRPALLVQIGNGLEVASDTSWQTQISSEWRSDVRSFTFQIGFFEWQDLGGEPLGWEVGADMKSEWHQATLVSENEVIGGKALLLRDIPALRQERHMPCVCSILGVVQPLADRRDGSVAKLMGEESHVPFPHPLDLAALSGGTGPPALFQPMENGGGLVILFDFGREVNGAFEVDLTAPRGTIVDLGYDEDREGRLPALLNAYAFADRYILRGGRQTVGNIFAERGFRFVQMVIREFDAPVHLHAVRGIDRLYPFAELASFNSSDPQLNQLWAICVHTMQVCSTDTFVDCPWRENTFYINDLLVENIVALQLFGDGRLSARCFRLMASQARRSGLIPAPVPYGILPGMTAEDSENFLILLGGNLFLPLMLEEYVIYTGDTAIVKELAEVVVNMLEAFALWQDVDGLIEPPAKHWNFIDWSFEMSDPEGRNSLTGRNTAVLNWLYVLALDSAARLASTMCGDDAQGNILRKKAAAVAASIELRFWSAERKCYVEWLEGGHPGTLATQVTQALALLSGRVPSDKVEDVVAALTRPDLLAPELYLHHFVLRALASRGKGAKALEVIRRYWNPVLGKKSPTVWECGVHGQGKLAFNGNGSGCHGFSTTPIDFIQTSVLGVRPLEPGFERCRILPVMLGLTEARGAVPTPHGRIFVDWRLDNGDLLLKIEIPPGITAELPGGHLVAGKSAKIRLSATEWQKSCG